MAISLSNMKKTVAKKQSGNFDNSIYPFWNMNFGKTAVLRFIPYIDPYTGGFWSERKTIPMQFVDGDTGEVVKFFAPCMKMYGDHLKCELQAEVSSIFSKAEKLKKAGNTTESEMHRKVASKHWTKIVASYQGFVEKDAINEENSPENPIRVFPFNKKLHNQIHESIFENEIDPFSELPCGTFELDDIKALVSNECSEEEAMRIMESVSGYTYALKKNKQGEWADWNSGSSWIRSDPHILSDEQLEAIANYGYHQLHEKLPPKPSDEQVEVLKEMLQVSIAHAYGDDDGIWNSEWEAVGFTPVKNRSGDDDNDDSSNSSSGGNNLANKIASKFSGGKKTAPVVSSEETQKKSSDVLSKIKKTTTAKKEPEVVEENVDDSSDGEVNEEVNETSVTEVEDNSSNEKEAPKKESQSDLAQRIRDKMNAKRK